MSIEVRTPVFEVPEGVDVVRTARVVGPEGTTILSTTTGLGVTVRVFDLDAGVNANVDIAAGRLTKTVQNSKSFKSALTTDGFWDGLDATGYSFISTLVQTTLLDPADTTTQKTPQGGHKLLVEYEITTTSLGTAYVRAIYIVVGKER